MSIQDDSRYSDVPDYAKTDEVPYYDGPYYEYRVPSQGSVLPPTPPVPYGPGQPVPYGPGMSVVPPPFLYPPPRRSWSKQTRALVIIGVVLALLLIGSGVYAVLQIGKSVQLSTSIKTATPTSVATETGTFAQASCPFPSGRGIIEGRNVTCGYLTVPEDHYQSKGRTIKLAVATFKAPQATSLSLPVVYLTGGPGGGALSDLGTYISSANLDEVTMGHDLIVLDQRGTGYSQPALNCQEFSQLQSATQDSQSGQNNINSYTQAAQQCHDRLTASGIDLNAYSTIQNAEDVHALIHALGYSQVNLYGVSYGTRLALTVMRLYPHDLRSVVLDSTVPTQLNLLNSEPAVTQHAYDTLFKGCSASPGCNSEYPSLQDTFYKLVSDLNVRPITIDDKTYGQMLVSGDDFANWLFTALYVTDYIPYLPQIISEVSQGNYTRLTNSYGSLTMDVGISDGMYYSVECGEDMAYTTLSDMERATATMRAEIRPSMQDSLRAEYNTCKVWNVKAVPAAQKQAVTSDVPTLILSGEYDPITPLANAQMAAKTLSNSHIFIFPATGHGVFLTGSCPDQVMSTFWQNPEQPQGTCTSSMAEPSFV